MKATYGYQIYRANGSLRVEAGGFVNRDAADYRAHEVLTSRDSHAVLLSYHWRGSKMVQARHVKRIEAPRVCKTCENPFKPKTPEQKYCNGNCASKDPAWVLKVS